MAGMGYGVMGTASRTGSRRAADAALAAITSPLLEAGAIDGAHGILINITGSHSLKLSEVYEASNIIHEAAHEDANIIFGAVLDERLGDEVKITVIATGFHQRSSERVVFDAAQPAFTSENVTEQNLNAPVAGVDFTTQQMGEGQDEQAKSNQPYDLKEEVESLPPETNIASVAEIYPIEDRTMYAQDDHFGAISDTKADPEPVQSEVLYENAAPIDYEEEDLLAYIEGPPFALDEVPDEAIPPHVTSERPAETELARLRQTAMAAYAAISVTEDESEALETATGTFEGASFAEILASRHGSGPIDEIEPDDFLDEDALAMLPETTLEIAPQPTLSLDNQVQWEDRYPVEPAFQNTHLYPPAIQDALKVESASIAEASAPSPFDSPVPMDYQDASHSTDARSNIPAENERLKKTTRDFNRRLNRDPDFFPGREASEVCNDVLTRVPSFAVAHDPDEDDTRLDELDIPAFLRRHI